MSDKKSTSDVSAVLVDWQGDLFALWCYRCCQIVECIKTAEPAIRCRFCTSKLCEKVEKDMAQAIMEGYTIQ